MSKLVMLFHFEPQNAFFGNDVIIGSKRPDIKQILKMRAKQNFFVKFKFSNVNWWIRLLDETALNFCLITLFIVI